MGQLDLVAINALEPNVTQIELIIVGYRLLGSYVSTPTQRLSRNQDASMC